jgi:peptidase M23-like protein
MTLAIGLSVASLQPALAAGNLTLPFATPNPRVTSWMDHHYPTREEDGLMVRFDGGTGYAYDGHRGIDYAIQSNTPVVAADEGSVIYSEWSDSGGWGVVIDHADDRTAYFHNNKLFVYPGQHVSRGQLIALSGSTGNSTGPHVHFEVRDLMVSWHSIDPYGWTGPGQDPWRWDLGYLFTSNPPVPFLLPLAFVSGARWNSWYGADGPPPPVTWQIRDGGHGLAGFAVRWDEDPGARAARTPATSGTAALPGPGSHTLHLRVFDRAGGSADVTYLYLYDVDPPTSAFQVDRGQGTALGLHWTASDALSGVKEVSIEVASGSSAFRPWLSRAAEQAAAGKSLGALRYFGEPGLAYQFRLTVRDAGRNPAPAVVLQGSVPAGASLPPSVADQTILGPLPAPPPGAPSPMGVRQEHPVPGGTLLLGSDGSLRPFGAAFMPAVAAPGSGAAAIDVASLPAGPLRLLSDGSTWDNAGAPGPRFSVSAPVRLLAAGDGTLVAVDAGGTIAGAKLTLAPALAPGVTLVDAGFFPGSRAGLALDSTGVVHALGGGDPALPMFPPAWTLEGRPAAIALDGTPQAPAGFITDANGVRQPFGSLLLLTDQTFSSAAFDPLTGLVVR